MYDFFYGTIFLMGDVTKVMTVHELEEKKEVKLQIGSSTKNTKQRCNYGEMEERTVDEVIPLDRQVR